LFNSQLNQCVGIPRNKDDILFETNDTFVEIMEESPKNGVIQDEDRTLR
jgi:hypothetical protein